MASEALEHKLSSDNDRYNGYSGLDEFRLYDSIDVYVTGTAALYTGPASPKPFTPKPFFPTSTGFGITMPPPLPGLEDYHETFKVDRYENLYAGHSSITINGRKIRIDHRDNGY